MPRGDKSSYTDKQKRKAEHIEEGYEDKGVSKKEAERRAWATVNKESGGGKKSGSGRGKKGNKSCVAQGWKESRKKEVKIWRVEMRAKSESDEENRRNARKRPPKMANSSSRNRRCRHSIRRKPGMEAKLKPRPRYEAPIMQAQEN